MNSFFERQNRHLNYDIRYTDKTSLNLLPSNIESEYRFSTTLEYLNKINETTDILFLIEAVADPREFYDKKESVGDAVKYLNQFLQYDGYKLVKEGLNYKVREGTSLSSEAKMIFRVDDWADLYIKIMGNKARIKYRQHVKTVSIKDLGFADERRKDRKKKYVSDNQWDFLTDLAKKKEISTTRSKDIKYSINKQLKALFDNDNDPIYAPRKSGKYKVKFNLSIVNTPRK